ncbi:competence protein CoiA [Neobacillus piezotolerans]|uniref:competence protein CoiA n=1 Tax=Neobacillus piezotolerans TaxID=2259171 RepID=UPI0015F1A04F|nr:competence protein CoiA family protein [Neobacillus piezotolerans]
MLTAKTKNGAKVCLADGYSRQTLQTWRSSEEFFCPVCGGKMMLKLGERKIFHFAHLKDACEESSFERESESHLSGKLALFDWLKTQGIQPAMEYYDPVIRQRPDIAFHFNGFRYAIEFQCSAIPEDLFMKRTNTYLSAGYIPLWIPEGSHLSRKQENTVALSGFEYLFLRTSPGNPGYIPYFCSSQGLFHIVQSIFPYSPSKAFARIETKKLNGLTIDRLIDPGPPALAVLPFWHDKLARSKLSIGANPKTPYMRFLKELYRAGMNIFLLPPEIGLPGTKAAAISTYPVIWQSYVVLDVLLGKGEGSVVTESEAAACLSLRAGKGDIRTRPVPLAAGFSLQEAAAEYLSLLSLAGVLVQKGDGVYEIRRKLDFPKTASEQIENESAFRKAFPASR